MLPESLIAATQNPHLTTTEIAISSGSPVVTRVFSLGGELWLASSGEVIDGETALVVEVQSFFRCKAGRASVPSLYQRAWHSFYQRHNVLVEQQVKTLCGGGAHELDDLCQEVWIEVGRGLRRLRFDPEHGTLSGWVIAITQRTVRRLLDPTPERIVTNDDLDSLPSPNLGPEDACHLSELCDCVGEALRRLRDQVSHLNYEVFRRRFIRRESVGEIAVALSLTPKAVRRRYDRTAARWQTLTHDLGLPGSL